VHIVVERKKDKLKERLELKSKVHVLVVTEEATCHFNDIVLFIFTFSVFFSFL
jgi:hypothetical protein